MSIGKHTFLLFLEILYMAFLAWLTSFSLFLQKEPFVVRTIPRYVNSILGLEKSTPNCVLYGELGRFSIDIEIKSRMVAFWKIIICNKQDKFAVTLYKL
jgi:hypothetical protein